MIQPNTVVIVPWNTTDPPSADVIVTRNPIYPLRTYLIVPWNSIDPPSKNVMLPWNPIDPLSTDIIAKESH